MLLEQVILQREKKPFLGFFNHFSVNIFLRDEREKKMYPSALQMQIEMVAPPPSSESLLTGVHGIFLV